MSNLKMMSSTLSIIIIAFTIVFVSALFIFPYDSLVKADPYGDGPLKSFTLVVDNFGYNGTEGGPTLIVNKGDIVEITLIGRNPNAHNLRIDEFDFQVGGEFGLTTKETDTNRFVADKRGTYNYFCRTTRLGGHQNLGEVGTLIVQ